jgi:hypothetical protein
MLVEASRPDRQNRRKAIRVVTSHGSLVHEIDFAEAPGHLGHSAAGQRQVQDHSATATACRLR